MPTRAANQVLHGEAADLDSKIAANALLRTRRRGSIGSGRPSFNKITVPVFLACQWEDEQTGGHCPELVRTSRGRLRSGSPSPTEPTSIRSTPTPCPLVRLSRAPRGTPGPLVNSVLLHAVAPLIYQTAMGLPSTDLVTLPVDPF